MLDGLEQRRLQRAKKRIECEATGQPMPEYTLDEFYVEMQWLADKLEEVNNELRKLNDECFIPEAIEFPNPLTLKVKDNLSVVIAVWEDDTYKCCFCYENHRNLGVARNHGRSHLNLRGYSR